jgi:hypothetical protein
MDTSDDEWLIKCACEYNHISEDFSPYMPRQGKTILYFYNMTIATLLNACWTVVTGAARQTVIALLRHGEVPQHMAFIMDGNRRFARKHQVAIEQGHRSGFDKLEQASLLLYASNV